MKNISIKTISLALVMGCTACSDVLDKGPLDKFWKMMYGKVQNWHRPSYILR